MFSVFVPPTHLPMVGTNVLLDIILGQIKQQLPFDYSRIVDEYSRVPDLSGQRVSDSRDNVHRISPDRSA